MERRKIIFAALLLLGLLATSGCSLAKAPPEFTVATKEVKRENLNLSYPAPLILEDTRWNVITEDNQAIVFRNMKDPVLFGVDQDNYTSISINMEKVQAYIEDLTEIIREYKDYYEKDPTDASH